MCFNNMRVYQEGELSVGGKEGLFDFCDVTSASIWTGHEEMNHVESLRSAGMSSTLKTTFVSFRPQSSSKKEEKKYGEGSGEDGVKGE